MNFWICIIELVKKGFLSLFETTNGSKHITIINFITFVCIPIGYSFFCYDNSIDLSDRVNDILTTISIFLAITLGVIFIVPDKLTNKIQKIKSKNESDIVYIKRYKKFCKLFIQRLTFLLLLSVFIIICSICLSGLPVNIEKYVSSIIMGLFILSILSILKLIVDIYIFLMEEMK